MNLLGIEQIKDYSTKRVMMPTSGGINSAAVICYVGECFPDEYKPKELFLFYSHLTEHSPDTFAFVEALVAYARTRFYSVLFRHTTASVNKYFISQKMIPHPTLSPCSRELKMRPLDAFAAAYSVDVKFVGYVQHEINIRYKRALKYSDAKMAYPILEFSEQDCFDLVNDVIGWHPAIYNITENGKRVFLHNNCLPCKNMSSKQLEAVGKYYPEYAAQAQTTQDAIPGAYWGREDVPDIFKCDVCERQG